MTQSEEERRAARAAYAREWYRRNAEKCRERSRANRAANPGSTTPYVQKWRAANPERARGHAKASKSRRRDREGGGDFSAQDWIDLLKEFDNACAYCQTRNGKLVAEHMTPLSRGGRHTKENVVPACAPCNGRKYTKTAFEFLMMEVT